MPTRSGVIETPEQLVAITHPTRLRVLDALRTADSAAGAARKLGEPRQRINHHVRELVSAGLLVDAGERRKGNFVEQLYESTAGTFVLSPRLAWGDRERVQAIADQVSLQHLVEFGERLQRDAAMLLDRAAFDGEQIPSATVESTVRFADADTRAAFLDEYLESTTRLIERYASASGTAFTVGIVVHPTVEEAGNMTEVETTFEIAATPAQAWKALEEVSIGRSDPEHDPREWWIPGFESRAVEVDCDAEKRLTARKAQQPCEGTLIAITFEHIETGTRVRVVQSGFDEAFVRGGGESFWIHSEHIFADLELFLQTGVIGRRAWRSLVWLGVAGATTSYGVAVRYVNDDSWASRIGLQPGDVLLTVAGAPLFSTRDLGTVQRVVHAGDEVTATWARAGDHFEQTAHA